MKVDFENLELIPKILQIVEELQNEIQYLTPDLTKRSGVAQYLKRSEKTIDNYINKSYFVENYHYKILNGRIVFIEEKIKEFRKIHNSKKHLKVIDQRLKKVN